MSSRRNVFLAAPVLALAGCAAFSSSTVKTDTAKVEAYVQGGVSTLQAYMLAFGSLMSSGTRTSASKALVDLSNAATAVGASIANTDPVAMTASTVKQVSGLLQLAVDALVAGLSSIASPGSAVVTAIGIVKEVSTFLPVLTAFVSSVTSPNAVGAASLPPIAATHLGIMIR